MNRKSSFRFTEWPMPPISGDVLCSMFFFAHFVGGVLNRFDNILVAGAAAKGAGNSPANFLLSRMRVLLERGVSRPDHSWCAKPALYPILFSETLLQRMQ